MATKRKKMNWSGMTEKLKDLEKTKSYSNDDGITENLFKPKIKEDGTFQAIIRFLPRPELEGEANNVPAIPFVKCMNHGFQDVGGWYIENCPTTIGKKCPVCEANGVSWKSGDTDTASKRGRRTSFYSNILIIKDPQTPENEGQVFIFRYGSSINKKILEKIAPDPEGVDEPVQIFDLDEGQNFKLKITKKGDYNNYDTSVFVETNTPVADSDEKIMAIEEKLYALGVIAEEEKFKEYNVLKNKFLEKIGSPIEISIEPPVATPTPTKETEKNSMDSEADDADFFKQIRED
jgi:hypothetical protein